MLFVYSVLFCACCECTLDTNVSTTNMIIIICSSVLYLSLVLSRSCEFHNQIQKLFTEHPTFIFYFYFCFVFSCSSVRIYVSMVFEMWKLLLLLFLVGLRGSKPYKEQRLETFLLVPLFLIFSFVRYISFFNSYLLHTYEYTPVVF